MLHPKSFLSRHAKRQQGFTLTETIVVLALITVLSAIAAPPFIQWMQNAEYRASARGILYVFRETRSRAITTNLEHRVEFENANRRYRVTRGNRASNSSDWSTVVCNWNVLPQLVHMHANVEKIHLNPTGTSNAGTVTIQDERAQTKYQVRIVSTGRVRIL
jgi:prepilin-type N-terminal cleavage/methylation domain-containing protein